MSMNDFLSQYYGTKTASANAEEIEKQAQMEIFAKLASDNGIDLEKLSEEQIAYLWNHTFAAPETTVTKTAEEHEDHEKVEKAKEEHDKKKEAAAKVAEAETLGQIMAHSMVAELKKLAAAGEMPGAVSTGVSPEDGEKNATSLGLKARSALEKGKRAVTDAAKGGGEAVKKHFERTGVALGGSKWKSDPLMNSGTMTRSHDALVRGAAAHGAGLAAVAGGAVGAHHLMKDKKKEKKSSAIDELAAEQAVVKAAEVGWSFDEAVDRVSAVLTLGAPESEKIASAQDLESAVDVRSLELLELAGYPVTWG